MSKKSEELNSGEFARLSKEFSILAKIISPIIETQMINPILNERRDNSKTAYDKGRHLDAWARILNIYPPCNAVYSENNNLYISFNEDNKFICDTLRIIEATLEMKNTKFLLLIACTFNKKLFDAIKTDDQTNFFREVKGKIVCSQKEPSKSEKEKLTEIHAGNLENFLTTRKKEKLTEILEQNIEKFLIMQREIFEENNEDLINIFVRMNQDISKLNKLNYNDIKKIILLENPNKLHSELVVSIEFPNAEYIGIFKLSCYLCDQILNEIKIGHRGTHSVLYLNKFNISEKLVGEKIEFFDNLINKIKDYLKDHWVDIGERIQENRPDIDKDRKSEELEMSDDEEEDKNLSINEVKINGESCTTLYELKKESLKLVELSGSSIEEYTDLSTFTEGL